MSVLDPRFHDSTIPRFNKLLPHSRQRTLFCFQFLKDEQQSNEGTKVQTGMIVAKSLNSQTRQAHFLTRFFQFAVLFCQRESDF
jgi:hypothetical protein